MDLTFVFHPIPKSKQIYLRFREKNWKQLCKKQAVVGFFSLAHSHLLTILLLLYVRSAWTNYWFVNWKRNNSCGVVVSPSYGYDKRWNVRRKFIMFWFKKKKVYNICGMSLAYAMIFVISTDLGQKLRCLRHSRKQQQQSRRFARLIIFFLRVSYFPHVVFLLFS